VLAGSAAGDLRSLQGDVGPGDLLDGTASQRLDRAGADLDRAAALVDGPWLTPLEAVPVVGRQVAAFTGMVEGTAAVVGATADGVDEARAVVVDGIPTGPERVDAFRALAVVAEETAAGLAEVDTGPTSGLVPGLGGAARRLATEKDGLEEALLRSRDASGALADLLEGPSTYLLFAANNAEMRAGSGMLLSIGLLSAEDGELSVGDLEPTEELVVPQPVGVTDPDIADRWGFTGSDQDFRNLLLSPRFAPNAEQATRMWSAWGRPPVDGVIVLDVLALEDLLEAVGPVVVGFETIDHTNVRRWLLHDQYTRVPDDDVGQAARRDALGVVAEAVLDRFDEAEPDPGALVRALRDAAAGRHLMIWSADEAVQVGWRGIGVAGDVASDGLLLSVLNDGNNKLDQYLGVEAEVVPTGRTGTVEMRVTNTVPPGEPNYIAGADPDAVGGYGVYPGRLSLHLPAGTTLSVVQGPEAEVAGGDGASEVITAPVRIAPGETVTWTVRYELGQDLDALRILPSARWPAVRWRVGEESWSDDRRPSRSIDL